DAITAKVGATARGELGIVTSLGRLVKFNVVDVPALPPTQDAPSLAGGIPVAELVTLAAGERVVGLAPLAESAAPITLGTRGGVVKRVRPDWPARAEDWSIISLKEGDEVIGIGTAADDDDLVFITDNAQLLRFSAEAVRPQGRTGGGVAGVRLAADAGVGLVWVVPTSTGGDVVIVGRSRA